MNTIIYPQRNFLHNGHKTAIKRKNPSQPMQYINDNVVSLGSVSKNIRYLDYGCGKGFDAEHYGLEKYDPHYAPQKPDGKFDWITCNFVLNVIPKKSERLDVLQQIHDYLSQYGTAFISVRRDIKSEGITQRGTYQYDVELPFPNVKCYKGKWQIYAVNKDILKSYIMMERANGDAACYDAANQLLEKFTNDYWADQKRIADSVHYMVNHNNH